MIQLKKIGEKSTGYRWMHDQEKIYYTQRNNIFLKLEVVMIAMIGTLTSGEFIMFVSKSVNTIDSGAIVSGIQLLIFMIFCIIKGLYEIGDFVNKIENHRVASSKFNNIFIDIDNQLRIPINKRETDYDFLSYKTKEYNSIMESSPMIRQSVIDQYILATEREDIYKPPVAGGFEKLEIVVNNNKNDIIIRSQNNSSNGNESPSYRSIDKSMDNKLKNQIDRWILNI